MIVQKFRSKDLEKLAEDSIPNYRKVKNEVTKNGNANKKSCGCGKNKRKRIRR